MRLVALTSPMEIPSLIPSDFQSLYFSMRFSSYLYMVNYVLQYQLRLPRTNSIVHGPNGQLFNISSTCPSEIEAHLAMTGIGIPLAFISLRCLAQRKTL